MNPRNPHAENIACQCSGAWGSILPPPPCPIHGAAPAVAPWVLQQTHDALTVQDRAARDVIDHQDRRLERYHSHLGSVYRVGRAASVLVGSALLGATVVDVAIGTPPVVPVLRLAGSAVCLVVYRWLRADERAWRAGE